MKNPPYKSLAAKKLPKSDREMAVLFGLIELYLKTGKPIGSHTLQESGFEMLSSATIRNYFSKMEEKGYLKQHHTSGGRCPTEKALKVYVDAHKDAGIADKEQEEAIERIFASENREVATLLHQGAALLSDLAKCAVFLGSPRFDQDFIQDVKLVQLDLDKLLSVLMTDFGLVRTEVIYLERPVTNSFLKSCEEYFLWRMNKGEKPLFPHEGEVKLAQRIYNEVMVRHVVGYVNFSKEDILRSGLSKLLAYPEFNDAAALAGTLSLLENEDQMRTLLRECCAAEEIKVWIGDDLSPFVAKGSECAVVAIPYRINRAIAGAVAFLGPIRMAYRNLFGLAQIFSEKASRALTAIVYKYKIGVRSPILLENQTRNP
jgi:heat-inducible transcriptional repressor